MTQPFILKVNDNVTTPIDFIGTTYKVADGGFNISLPRVKRELQQIRPSFYIPIITNYEYREATIKFEIWGTTRSAVIGSLQAIERVLNMINARKRIAAGRRSELSYAWEGATNITYFEVFGGEVKFPSDALSVEKMYRQEAGKYVLTDCELTLYLSAGGYSISIFSDTLTEVPLYNPSIGAPATGGVAIQNPGFYKSGTWLPLYNYVEMLGSDLNGSMPFITRIQLASDSPYTAWNTLYMGLQQTPFPSVLSFDSADAAAGSVHSFTTTTTDAASKGSYLTRTYSGSVPFYNIFEDIAWSISNASAGIFYSFLHAYSGVPASFHLAVGIDDYVSYGIQTRGDWVTSSNDSTPTIPLGVIQLPPTGLDLVNYGTLNSDLWMGLFVSGETGATLTADFMSLLPIANGLRIWRSRLSALTGTMYDDAWRGLEYLKNGSTVATPFYGLMEPLKIEPGITQRIYFTSIGTQANEAERLRKFIVRVYVVPTVMSLAV